MNEVRFSKESLRGYYYTQKEGNLAHVIAEAFLNGDIMWFAEQERYWVRGALFELSGFYIHPPYLLNIVQQANGYRDYDFEALEEELIEEELAITDSDGRVLVKVPQPEGGGEYQAYRLHLPNIFSKGEEFETYEEEPVWYP